MNKAFAIGLALSHVVLVIGIGLVIALQYQDRERADVKLGELGSDLAAERNQIHRLDESQAVTAGQMDASVNSLRLIAERLTESSSKQEIKRLEDALAKLEKQLTTTQETGQRAIQSGSELTKRQLESLSAKIAEKPVVQPVRWGYVDKFKLRDTAKNAMKKKAPLPPDQDPDHNPELAGKREEYDRLQIEIEQKFPTGMRRDFIFSRGVEVPTAGEKEKRDEYEALQLKLAGLRAPLAAYLRHKTGDFGSQDALVDQAIHKFAEGKFDLLIDKTFGDHSISYRSSQPIPDVTDAVAEVVRELAGKQD